MPSKWNKDTKDKAIRLVHDHIGDYESEWAAITAISGRLGMSSETLRKWLRQREIDAGAPPGTSDAPALNPRTINTQCRETPN